MKTVKMGIIGLGHMGKIHMNHSLKNPNIDLVAVADSSKRALREAKNAGIKKTFTNYEQLLHEPDIDAVIIGLPTHLHFPCAIHAAETGKHIFLEKPIASNLKDAEGIVKAAHDNSVKLMMGYHLRFSKHFQELKAKLDSGLLGDVEVAYATFASSGPFFHRSESHTPIPVPDWWFNKELTGGGALMDVGVHVINLLRWYFGEITHIKSHLGYRFNLDFEDTAICLAKFESGTTAVVTAGWFLQGYQLKVDFFGTVKHAAVEHSSSGSLKAMVKKFTPGVPDFRRPHFDELHHFAKCLIQDLSPSPSGEDGLNDVKAIYQAYQNSVGLE